MVKMESVSKLYPNGHKAVDNLTLSVPKGETLVLVGTSGCGKTTTLKMINQLIQHTSGQILVDGKDVTTINPVELRRQIGYVIQQVGLMPHLNIMNNITFVLQITKYPKAKLAERAEEMLQVVGLPSAYLERYPRQLSGGEQQRIGVARALAADPEIILMDEPFGALDPINRDQLQKEMLNLQSKLRKTIIFVTHDIQEAFRLGNRVGVMTGGKLVKVDKPIELVVGEQDTFVRNFVGTKGIFDLLELVTVKQSSITACPVLQLGQTLDTALAALGSWDYGLVTDGRNYCGKLNRGSLLAGSPQGVVTETMIEPSGPPVSADDTLRRAVELMVMAGWSWLPVLDGQGAVQGIVTIESCSGTMQAREG